MHSVLDRLRIATRTLRKQPVFTAVVVLSLGLAIALNTTMYGMLDALIRPRSDVRDPKNLYWIQYYGDMKKDYNPVDDRAREIALHEGAPGIESITSFAPFYMRGLLEHGGNAAERSVAGVGFDFFSLLDVRAADGRTFIPSDTTADVRPMVITPRLAAQLFPGDTNVLGERVHVGDSTFAIVGVLSPHVTFPEWPTDAFVLTKPTAKSTYVRAIRVRSGVTRAEIERQLDHVARRLALAAGRDPRWVSFRIKSLTDPEFHYKGAHVALIFATIAVLLVACANVANMQLARGVGRRRELALRSALGASRRRVIGHLLLESSLLAVIGLALGLVLTFWATAALHAAIPPAIGNLIVEPQWSWRVFLSAIAATVACIVIVGVAPSIAVSRVDPNELLKAGAGTGATRHQRRQYGYLVVVEVALALALLSGATVLVRSSLRMADFVDGYDTAPLARASLTQRLRVGERRALNTVLAEAVQRARSAPGVENATAVVNRAVAGDTVMVSDSASGVRTIPAPLAGTRVVTPSYLRTMGLPLISGRDFIDGERDAAVALIDDYTARSLWPNRNPIGALLKLGAPTTNVPYVRVVGVFGYRGRMIEKRKQVATSNDVRLGAVVVLPGPADSVVGATLPLNTMVTVRSSSGDARPLPIALRRVGFSFASTMDDLNGSSRQKQTVSFIMTLFIGFAAFGLGLAAFGVYGVVAHSVAERRRELGVRIALGASDRDILRAVLRESVAVGLAGVALGLFVTKYSVQLLGAYALEDEIYNAPMFAGVAAFLFLVAAGSALIPALRATRVDPTESLRSE